MFGVFSKNGTMMPTEEYQEFLKLEILYGMYGMDNSTGIPEMSYETLKTHDCSDEDEFYKPQKLLENAIAFYKPNMVCLDNPGEIVIKGNLY